MIWRISLIAWALWGGALILWLAMGTGPSLDLWTTLFVLWVLNGGLLWLILRQGR